MDKSIYSKESESLVKQLKKARKEAKLNQNEAARLIYVSQSYISKVESGQIRMDIIQLKNFAKVYGKSIDFFLR
jgi:transcriptional regulator with XRE-family HTH domain